MKKPGWRSRAGGRRGGLVRGGGPGSCRRGWSEAGPGRAERFQGKMGATGDRGRTECNSQARRDERGGKGRAGRESSGCGRRREQQQLSDRSGSGRRASTAELGGDVLGSGDGPSDAHRPAAAGADGDVDAKDPSEELHPRQARGGSVAEVSVEQGCDGGQLELAAGMKRESCLGSCSGSSAQGTTAERRAWWAESTP